MKPTVLIVDDSLTVRMDLAEAFESEEMETRLAPTIAAARGALSERRFDLMILDVLLPDGNGVELLRELRRDPATSQVPILMLSGEADVKDRILGLEHGADDYV